MVCKKLSQLVDITIYHRGHRNWKNSDNKQYFKGDAIGGGHLINPNHFFGSDLVFANLATC